MSWKRWATRRKNGLTLIREENGVGLLLPARDGGLEVVYLTGEVVKRPYDCEPRDPSRLKKRG